MDTGTHFRAIWRRRWRVLGVAVAAGLLVLGVRAAQEQTFSAQAELFLVPPRTTGGASTEIERLTVGYGELVRDPRVLDDLVRRAALPIEPGDVRRLVEVTSPADGRLTVVARQPTAERAAALADATADALSAGAVLDQAEALRRELLPLQNELQRLRAELQALPPDDPDRRILQDRQDAANQAQVERLSEARARLDVVRRAQAESADRTPQPLRDAVLAFLLALILAAEAAALIAARRRGIEGGDPVQTVEAWSDLPVFRVGESPHGPDESGPALRYLRADDERPLFVAPLSPSPRTSYAVERLLQALVLMGGRSSWVDLRHDAEGGPPPSVPAGTEAHRPRHTDLERVARRQPPPTVVSADAWESPELLRLGELLPGICVLLVDVETSRQPELVEAVRVLAYAGMTPQAVLVVDQRGERPTLRLPWSKPAEERPPAASPRGPRSKKTAAA